MPNLAVYTIRPVLAEGLRIVVDGHFALAGVCSTLEALDAQICRERPDILLLEVTPALGLESLANLINLFPGGGIILWIDAISAEFASQALAMGVRGLLHMGGTPAEYLECFRAVLAGGMVIAREVNMTLRAGRQIRLSPRERQLMGLVAQGLRNKELAWSLGIKESTVKVYISRLFEKVGASDRLELALMALRNLSASHAGGLALPTGGNDDRAVPYPFPGMMLVHDDVSSRGVLARSHSFPLHSV